MSSMPLSSKPLAALPLAVPKDAANKPTAVSSSGAKKRKAPVPEPRPAAAAQSAAAAAAAEPREKKAKAAIADWRLASKDGKHFRLDAEDAKKRVTVQTFKGSTSVHIRAFYEKNGEYLPSKQGVALSLEQVSRRELGRPSSNKSSAFLS